MSKYVYVLEFEDGDVNVYADYEDAKRDLWIDYQNRFAEFDNDEQRAEAKRECEQGYIEFVGWIREHKVLQGSVIIPTTTEKN
jgi:hypothetical protein